jgi:hypothetical protein
MIFDLVVFIYHPLPIFLSSVAVLFRGFLGSKLRLTAMCVTLVDYSVVLYGSLLLRALFQLILLKGRNHFEELDISLGSLIKFDMAIWIGFVWLKI